MIFFSLFLSSICLTGAMRLWSLRKNLLAIPNARSSHSIPTPHGGGAPLVVLFFLGSTLLWTRGDLDFPSYLAYWAAAPIALLGFVDDLISLPPRIRLPSHFLAATWALACLEKIPLLQIPCCSWEVDLWMLGLFAIGIVWMLNLTNFMDGIDGIAAAEVISTLSSACLLTFLLGKQVPQEWLCLLSITCGFLIWNWPPAKIFLGDVGSSFLGFLLGLFPFSTYEDTGITLWAWIILLGSFAVDATFTLLRRAVRGDPVAQAHRSHAYQKAAQLFGSHRPVTLFIFAINGLWLLPMAFLAIQFPHWGVFLMGIAWLPLIGLCWMLGAGMEEKK